MAYLVLLFFILCCTWKIIRGKDALPIILLYYFIAPNIPLGSGLVVDSSYIFIFVLLIVSAIVSGGVLKLKKQVRSLALLTIVWIVTYMIGWIVNGASSQATFFIAILGLIKTLAAVILCFCLCGSMTKEIIYYNIGKGLSLTVISNAIAIILQFLFPYQMYDLCYELYYTASSSGYTSYERIESWGAGFYNGRYYRYFGLNETPMVLSCIIVVVLSFLLIQAVTRKQFFGHPKIIGAVAIFVGTSAQCKIFFLMLPILGMLYVLFDSRKLTRRKLFLYMSGCIACLLIIIFLDEISSISTFRYLAYITSPLQAFATRFGDGKGASGYLTETLSVALNHFLTGVGPISISGEPIADSSFVVIFHHGGIVALLAMIVFYVYIIKENSRHGNNADNILVISMLIMGLSRTNLIFGNLLIVTMLYIYMNYNAEGEKFNSRLQLT